MKNFEIKAQSTDTILMTIEAEDIYQAADAVAEHFGVTVWITNGIGTFETATEYYDLRPVAEA